MDLSGNRTGNWVFAHADYDISTVPEPATWTWWRLASCFPRDFGDCVSRTRRAVKAEAKRRRREERRERKRRSLTVSDRPEPTEAS